jgi:hypothetical protein
MGADGEVWALEGLRAGIKNGVDVPNPDSLPYFLKIIDRHDDLELKNPFENMNPFFQACYSLLQTGSLHFTWEKGIHSQPFELRKTSAIFQSPSFRKALKILEREEPTDPDDPFTTDTPIVPTAEERIKAHEFLKKAMNECPGNPEPQGDFLENS